MNWTDEDRRKHDCATCEDCIHDGHKCCGCYDGACCQAGQDVDARVLHLEATLARVWEYADELRKARTGSPGDNPWSMGYREGAKDEREIIANDLRRALDGAP